MAISEVAICNSALVKIGEERIASLDDPGKAARTCKRQYPLMRDLLLESYNWTFAVRRAQLTPDGTAPAFGFSNRFLLPHNSLRFLGIAQGGFTSAEMHYSTSTFNHKIEGRYLLFDDTSVNIFYIEQVTDPTQFSAGFIEALALKLAIDISYDLTGGAKQEAALERRFDRQIKSSRVLQAIQGQPEILQATEWLDSRFQDMPVVGNPWAFGSGA